VHYIAATDFNLAMAL